MNHVSLKCSNYLLADNFWHIKVFWCCIKSLKLNSRRISKVLLSRLFPSSTESSWYLCKSVCNSAYAYEWCLWSTPVLVVCLRHPTHFPLPFQVMISVLWFDNGTQDKGGGGTTPILGLIIDHCSDAMGTKLKYCSKRKTLGLIY